MDDKNKFIYVKEIRENAECAGPKSPGQLYASSHYSTFKAVILIVFKIYCKKLETSFEAIFSNMWNIISFLLSSSLGGKATQLFSH